MQFIKIRAMARVAHVLKLRSYDKHLREPTFFLLQRNPWTLRHTDTERQRGKWGKCRIFRFAWEPKKHWYSCTRL